MEAARTFVNEYGLVLFAPRPLGAPAPSFVEATLGESKASATPAESDTARGLVARLIAEGSALPLNLLGGPGDLPDFVVSTAVFPFVFTLRGDKGWKRAPETSGAVKVTPLGLRVFELLTQKGAMTVAEMVPEIGREVTDSAVLRALNELWSLLRVLPGLQAGEGATIWELTTARFSKAVKAGANAGQPTALSALVSLYLGQAYVASEEEIASFLSPLTARSRVREVLHGLTAGRQLSEAVIEGKAVLYIPESLPDFAGMGAKPDTALEEGADEPTDATVEADAAIQSSEPASEVGESTGADAIGEPGRIRRFDAGAATPLRGKPLRGKPIGREGSARSGARTGPRPSTPRPPRAEGERPRSSGGYGAASDRPQRPTRPAGDRPSFNRPWDEERASRPSAEGRASRPYSEGARPPRAPRSGDDSRPPRRETGGDRPFRPARPRDDGRPPFRREGATDRPPFRRREEGGGSDRPAKRPFTPGGSPGGDRPSFGDRAPRGDRPSFGDRAPRGDRPSFGDRAPRGDRPSFGDRAPRGDRPSFGDRPRAPRPPSDRPYTPRPFVKREGGADGRPPRRDGDRPSFDRGGSRPGFARPGGDRGATDRPRTDRPSLDRPSSGRASGDRPTFARPSFDRPRREGGSDRGPGAGAGRPPFRGPAGESRGSGRPGGGDAGRPSFRSGPGASRGAPRGGPAGGAGGFSRGPKRDAPSKFAPRGAAKGASRGRPAPGRKPEDEA